MNNAKNNLPSPDACLKKFFYDNEVFADLFNTYAFEGKEVIDASILETSDSAYVESVHTIKGIEKVNRYRDIVRKSAFGAQFIIIAVENQNKIHYAMPVRVMLYDVLGYSTECRVLGREQKQEETESWTVDEMLSSLKRAQN